MDLVPVTSAKPKGVPPRVWLSTRSTPLTVPLGDFRHGLDDGSSAVIRSAVAFATAGRPISIGRVELRRALLLFAIVLGVAAIVASVSDTSNDARDGGPATDAIDPTDTAQGNPVTTLRFSATGEPRTQSLRAGRPATVLVEVDHAGQVDLERLGLSAAAEPSTPAHFDVLTDQPGDYPLRFTRAGDEDTRTIGTLQVVPAGQ